MTSNDKKRRIEPVCGVTGLIFLLEPEIRFGISLADWISRGQTVLTFRPYVAYIAAPWAVGGGLIIGFTFVYFASKLEKIREDDDAPKIILPYGMKHEKKKKKNFWLVLGFISLLFTVGLLFLLGAVKRFQNHDQGTSTALSNNVVHGKDANKQYVLENNPHPQQKIRPVSVMPAITATNLQSVKDSLSRSTSTTQPAIPVSSDQRPNQQTQASSQPLQENQTTQPTPDAPVACPPLGTFSSGWMISNNSNSVSSKKILFTIELQNLINSRMSPLLSNQIMNLRSGGDSELRKELDESQAKEAYGLLEELNSRLPKPKAIPTPNGPIEFLLIPSVIRRFLIKDTDSIWFYSEQKTLSGIEGGSVNKSFSIATLSPRDRKLINELDKTSNTVADDVCKEALNRLVPHKQ